MKRQIKVGWCFISLLIVLSIIVCVCICNDIGSANKFKKVNSMVPPSELNIYEADAIPLASLSEDDKEEYFRCLSSICETANEDYILDIDPLYMSYEYDGVYSEFFHSVTHINFGVLADYFGWEDKSTYIPELGDDYIEYYIDEIKPNQEVNLLTGKERIINIVSDNDLLLDRIYVPYVDDSLQMKTQKIRLYEVGEDKNIAVCYGQMKIEDIGVDNESGYVDDEDVSPFTWRCVSFYIAPHIYDVIDIYRGISNLALTGKITASISFDGALSILTDTLSKNEKYEVRSIELAYSYYPNEFYVTDYLDYKDVTWYHSYMFRPVWKILFKKNSELWVALIDIETGNLNIYRVANLGY